MDESEWSGPDDPPVLEAYFGGQKYKGRECPGSASKHPAVVEATKARFWLEKGAFEIGEPDPPESLIEAVETLAVAFNLFEHEKLSDNG